uniref:Uncharacterized protein n=1 Tax=Arundo donax TaxID=35708 RepID=A0A0A9DX15_ARUDO
MRCKRDVPHVVITLPSPAAAVPAAAFSIDSGLNTAFVSAAHGLRHQRRARQLLHSRRVAFCFSGRCLHSPIHGSKAGSPGADPLSLSFRSFVIIIPNRS